MVDVEMQGGSARRKKVINVWYKVLADYKAGRTAKEIADEHGRTRSWVYWVLSKFKNNEV